MIDLNATFFAQILNFLILVALLRYFCYKPVVRMLKARQDRIAESIEKADADAAEAEKLLEENRAMLAQAGAEAQSITDRAEQRARAEREASIAETRKDIEKLKKAAEAEIQRERERAEENLRAQVVQLSMEAAGKVISKNLDSEENEKIINDFINNLDKSKLGDLSC